MKNFLRNQFPKTKQNKAMKMVMKMKILLKKKDLLAKENKWLPFCIKIQKNLITYMKKCLFLEKGNLGKYFK